ncbi:MAG: hypothetical protein ABH848_03085 [Candidatus Omnitrophota bacterium]
MLKTWMKFSLGGILFQVCVTAYAWDTIYPSHTIPELFSSNPMHFIGILIGICLWGIAIGTILFFIWYFASGRKTKK